MTPPTAPGSPAPGDQGGMLGVTGRCFVQFLNLNAQSDTQDPTAAKSEWKTAPSGGGWRVAVARKPGAGGWGVASQDAARRGGGTEAAGGRAESAQKQKQTDAAQGKSLGSWRAGCSEVPASLVGNRECAAMACPQVHRGVRVWSACVVCMLCVVGKYRRAQLCAGWGGFCGAHCSWRYSSRQGKRGLDSSIIREPARNSGA